jgi:hypothetical protein
MGIGFISGVSYPISNCKPLRVQSEMTLNYRMVVVRYPNLKKEVGGLIPDHEISCLLDGKFTRWSIASCALALACLPYVQKTRIK